MNRRLLRGNWNTRLFLALYLCVSAATFRHSAHGFASIEGSFWWGALSALAVDVGMILSADGLRVRRNRALFIGLAVSAVASTYTQLLYSVSSARVVEVAPGAEWLGSWARDIIDARVIALPALLPVLAIVYAFSAKRAIAVPAQSPTLDEKAAVIRAQTDALGKRAAAIWQLSGNGYSDLTVTDVAALARCSESTARNARER